MNHVEFVGPLLLSRDQSLLSLESLYLLVPYPSLWGS